MLNEAEKNPRHIFGKLQWAGCMIGFALGGFFDGILLHQLLQWHHLLSGLEQTRLDIRVLVFWDGIFHALMYIIAIFGVCLLWRARSECTARGTDRCIFANTLVGFGAWHVADGILSHWLLGIHRVRMDVGNPLFWDLLWFAVFGVIPLTIGWIIRRGGPKGGNRTLRSPPILLAVALSAGSLSALPPSGQSQVTVLFSPGTSELEAFSAIASVNGKIIASDASGQLWAVDMPADGNRLALYRHGALLVSNSALPLGCFNWTRA
ncbi:DUF2243 domain-containing protein [Rhizobium pusense]|nr:DUF2243 domain-containing protein [Agrobacterium pusense]MBW9069920.1 DUF2243 domain-containing protein [Agrobacterium pusense]MBW9084841.1 DUF2243 domain-containing protein [Agrobacterium pusense]MBW9125285.1 DUF2243 domain-containing protein [Agrobacterium pusense]MBW9137700.1 DUF2243 domain-containing protein [Agrobacterium pusense]